MNRLLDTWNKFGATDLMRFGKGESVLGIDISPDRAYVVEIARRGLPLTHLRERFDAVQSFSCTFHEPHTAESMAGELKSAFEFCEVETRLAVAAIQGPGVRIVTVNLPANVEDVDEWIAENAETLIGLPGGLSGVICRYEIYQSPDGGEQLELTFVKKADIEKYAQAFSGAGIHLLGLAAGPRALSQILPYFGREVSNSDTTLLALSDHVLTKIDLREGKVLPISVFPMDADQEVPASGEELSLTPGTPVVIAGEDLRKFEIKGAISARPFDLEPVYALASGIALGAFVGALASAQFLSEGEQMPALDTLYRKVEKRSMLALGGALLLLLIFQFGLSSYLKSEIDGLQKSKGAMSNRFVEVEALEHRVAMLDQELGRGKSALMGDKVAKLVHDAAVASPESLWFSKLEISRGKSGTAQLSLHGYSASTAKVASLIRRLNSGPFRNTRLIRSESAGGGATGQLARRLPRNFVAFEIASEGSNR